MTIKSSLYVLCILSLTGCATNVPLESRQPIAVTTTQSKGAPDWIDNEESIPGTITAVGISQPNPLGDKSMQRTEALADARAKLAQKISVKVQGVFSQLNQRITAGGNSDSAGKLIKTDAMTRMIEDTRRQIVNVDLAGASARQFWTDPSDGNLFVQMVLAKETLDKMLTITAGSVLRKEIAQGSIDLQSALVRLDEAVENNK